MLDFRRRKRLHHAAAMLLSGLAGAGWAAAAEPEAPVERPEKYPIEDFGRRPFLDGPKLSPDGRQVAATAEYDGKPVIVVINLFDRKQDNRPIGTGESHVRWYRWAGSDRLLIGLLMKGKFYGYDVYVTRLALYEVSTEKITFLVKKQQGFLGDDVLFIADDGSYILLETARDAMSSPAVYRVDLATQDMELVQPARDSIWEWIADREGTVRAGFGFNGRRLRVIYRDHAGEEFRTLTNRKLEETEGEIDTVRIPAAGDKGYVLTNSRTGRFAVYEFDWKTLEIGATVFEHPEVDVDEITMKEDGSSIEAAYYTDERERVVWFDPEMQALQQEIDEALVGRMNWVVSSSRDRTRFIVWTGTASDPGHYYYFNRPAERMERLATPHEALKGRKLAPVKAVRYRARDGLEIPAYLTLPVGREPKGLPLVLLPHGGPHARDSWRFDYWVQFLANRGYAVLQPNFRGSAGYGKDFLAKGFGQWGAAMQDDLTDGAQWLIAEGIVDAQRICIMGASYGGYAALMGVIRTPELFRCAISWAGVTDVNDMMRFDRSQMLPERYKNWRNRVRGEAEVDLRAVSPVHRVADINAPVLLMHGRDDDNVPFRQARDFVKAMGKASKPLEFIEFPEAGHAIDSTGDRVRFLTAIDAFLARHNPAD